MISKRAGNGYPISYKEKPIIEKIAEISREASIDHQAENLPGNFSVKSKKCYENQGPQLGPRTIWF